MYYKIIIQTVTKMIMDALSLFIWSNRLLTSLPKMWAKKKKNWAPFINLSPAVSLPLSAYVEDNTAGRRVTWSRVLGEWTAVSPLSSLLLYFHDSEDTSGTFGTLGSSTNQILYWRHMEVHEDRACLKELIYIFSALNEIIMMIIWYPTA